MRNLLLIMSASILSSLPLIGMPAEAVKGHKKLIARKIKAQNAVAKKQSEETHLTSHQRKVTKTKQKLAKALQKGYGC